MDIIVHILIINIIIIYIHNIIKTIHIHAILIICKII